MSAPNDAAARSESKKPYEKPEVIFIERIEVRAVVCALGEAASCSEGPIQS